QRSGAVSARPVRITARSPRSRASSSRIWKERAPTPGTAGTPTMAPTTRSTPSGEAVRPGDNRHRRVARPRYPRSERMADQFHFHPESYLELVRAEVPDYELLQDTLAEAAAELEASIILDLGTGTGETLRRVAARHPNARLVGVDESEGMLAVARSVVPSAELRVGRLQDALPDEPFDLVVSALAVHHLDAHEKADLFRRVARRLAPGGRFVLADVIVPEDPADVV